MKSICISILSGFMLFETGFATGRLMHPAKVDTIANTLSIGDRVPDVTLSNVHNYEKETARLSEFRGKLVILDFWNVGCTPCIKSMPKMQALQDKFKDRLQVILVTKDPEDKVARLFERVKILEDVHLTSVVGDTALWSLFPFRLVPTHVWISEDGEVLQITTGFNTVEEKIADYFEGKEVNLPVTNQHKDFDMKTPLWMEGGGRQLKYMKYYSYIMEYAPDAGSLTGVNRDPETGKAVRVVATNQSILKLCKMAYGESRGEEFNPFTYDNRVILNVSDPSTYFYPLNPEAIDEWGRENLYCYELVVPPDKSAQLFEFMQQDIARYFNVSCQVEKRKMNCLVLKRTTSGDRLATKGGQFRFATDYGEGLSLRNLSVEWFLNMLRSYNSGLSTPIIDGTGYSGNIDIEIEANLGDLKAVRKELRGYGLDLVEEEREVEVLVVREGE